MSELAMSQSVAVSATPATLYDLVSDVTRIGEFSPVCKACWWDDGDGPRVGAWFTGRNETPERTWETRSQVVAAEPEKEFAFVVGGGIVRWGYTFTPTSEGTLLTESWQFLPSGVATFQERYGEDTPAQIAKRVAAAEEGIPATLAALKKSAEARSH
jgi:hypothetical protein